MFYTSDILILIKIATEISGYSLNQLQDSSRTMDKVYIRAIMSYILHQYGLTYQQIGTILNRHYSSIIHAIKIYNNEYQTNNYFISLVKLFNSKLHTYKSTHYENL